MGGVVFETGGGIRVRDLRRSCDPPKRNPRSVRGTQVPRPKPLGRHRSLRGSTQPVPDLPPSGEGGEPCREPSPPLREP